MRQLNAARTALEEVHNISKYTENDASVPLQQDIAEYQNLLKAGFPTDPN